MPGCYTIRQVTIFDIFLARVCSEVASNLAAVVASFAVFYSVGLLDLPRDLPMFYLGLFLHDLVVGGDSADHRRSERAHGVGRKKFGQPYSYLYMMFSGFFFLAAVAAAGLRGWALLSAVLCRHMR